MAPDANPAFGSEDGDAIERTPSPFAMTSSAQQRYASADDGRIHPQQA